MTKPLALVHYEKLLPGSQLVNRLHDIGYRVETATTPRELPAQARQLKPMLVVVDASGGRAICEAVSAIRADSETGHLPILAFAADEPSRESARRAGATMVANDAGVLDQLPHLLEQVLQFD
jgi:DNA-binding response OmpR family regulator